MSLLHHIRFGGRMLRKDPVFAVVAVLVLGLGIGAASAVFSVVNAVLLDPLPIAQPEQVFMLWENQPERGHGEVELSYPNYLDWRNRNTVFEHVAALSSVNMDYTLVGGGEPEQVEAAPVTPNFFDLLGAHAQIGRIFTSADSTQEANNYIILSHGLWQRRFGGRASAVGEKLVVEGQTVTVIGVMPRDFDFPRGTEIWTPMIPTPDDPTVADRGFRVLRGIGRLKPGVTQEAAQRAMDELARRLGEEYPRENKGFGVTMIPLLDAIYGDTRPALKIMMGAVALVLLVVCVNIANLLLVRGTGRRREFAVRLALGADSGAILRQLLAENLLLALAGGAVGLLVAMFGVDLLAALAPPDIPRLDGVGINVEVVLFTLGIALLAALIFGMAPALEGAKTDLNGTLKDGGERAGGRVGLRGALVVAEIALAVVLMTGAGLLVRSFDRMRSVDPGFRPERVFSARVPLQRWKYQDPKEYAPVFERILERVRNIPGVESAATVLMRPLSGTVGWDYPYTVEGQSPSEHQANPYANYEVISPGYFATMGIALLKGRDFDERDRGDLPVAIVSEGMARRYWGAGDPIGRKVKFGSPESKNPWMTVVGVAGDVRYREWDSARPDIYFPMLHRAQYRTDFVVRTSSDPIAFAREFRSAVYAVDKEQAVTGATTMEEVVDHALARSRFTMLLLALFAFFALLLASLGIYGVMAYTASARTREIGIRMALGASRADIIGLSIRRGARLVLAGVAIGLVAAFAVRRVVGSILFDMTPNDPITFVAVPLLLAAVALLACYIPARRASRIDPVRALQYKG